MEHRATLMMAIDLLQMPTQVRLMKKAPLPDGVVCLLQIAAGDEKAIQQAIEVSGRSRTVVCEASTFFIEQLLFYPEADAYRVLGAQADTSNAVLRRNMALLLRWLHPDMDRKGERSWYAHRVTKAWNDLKTEERRAAYDRSRPPAKPERRHASNRGNSRMSMQRTPVRAPLRRPIRPHPPPMGFWRRLLMQVFGRTIR